VTFTQQVHDCGDHTVTDPAGREVTYACTVIRCYADTDVVDPDTGRVIHPAGTLVWESHDDATIDPAGRVNPDHPAEDHRGAGDPTPITPA